MREHRASYWKTAVSAGLIGLIGLAALVWLLAAKLMTQNPWPFLADLAWWVGGIALLSAASLAALVCSGAMVSLHRDSLESRGLPYVRKPREWSAGFLSRGLDAVLRGLSSLRSRRPGQLDLRAGEIVEIRSLDEILATLDSRGERDSLPFMPEMEAWCGKQARVFRRVNKIWDWIHFSGQRRMLHTVILENLRCDGCYHGGCQGDCPLLWKEAWLRRASEKQRPQLSQISQSSTPFDLRQFTTRIDQETSETRFVCQLCRLPEASTLTSWNNPRNLLNEVFCGNVRIGPFLTYIAIHLFNSVQRRKGGPLFPFLRKSHSNVTPNEVLNLQPGELVRVKSKHEIERTLGADGRSRGLWFDNDMTRFCGGTYTVRARATCQIDERTGKFVTFKNPCITLEDVTAVGEYYELAPLDERIFWRETWLERVT